MSLSQKEKALLFRAQHSAEKLLILANVWDPLGAKLMAAIGYPSLATASVPIALANGYPDGQHIPYTLLMELISKITSSVDLPVSVDLERGFAEDINQLKDNIKKLLDAGAIGLNIEDSPDHGKTMIPVAEQCRKIEAIREAGIEYGVPLVINARTDLFFQPAQDNTLSQVIERGKAYQTAGADCFYPMMMSSYHDIAAVKEALDIPLNILLFGPIRDLKQLEALGISRISVGPGLMKAALSKMKSACEGLLNYDAEEFLEEGKMSFEFMLGLV
jgi:2-methylisocitrate lyase-like PEP mutase family enzyme